MINIIENYKVNRAINKRKREKMIEQACCPHEIVYIGDYSEQYSIGYCIEFRTVYQGFCPICDKTISYYDKSKLDLDIAKQNAREKFEIANY